MRRSWAFFIISILFISGCVPNFEQDEEIVQENEETQETAIVPNFQISEQYYRTVLPFKASESRGLVVNRISNRLDIDEFETGLMRLSQNTFSSEDYLYQDGQYLDRDTITSWLQRKLTDEELAKVKEEDRAEENRGLNPAPVTVGSLKEQNEASPIYLSHLLEQNYLKKDNEGKAELGGISIGLALNSVHYYNQEDGYPREYVIPDAEIEQQGKKMADEIIKRIRSIEGLENIPVVVSLFKQEARSSVVPGSFFAVAEVKGNSNSIDKWSVVREDHYLLPSTAAQRDYRDDHTRMLNFKADIDEYFPNYTGVIGRAFYRDEQLTELSIDIPMQFYGKAEVVGFTQYLTGLIMEHFPNYFSVKCYISSIDGPEAVIIRGVNEEEPFVHIYQ
ncbi:protein involved in sex pheromone biosynthesis [Bacillus mesophilus]|uniref:CamS family sex pheromone protein n=1 Tax=Bacillus mesophilus TaxID=1808955 RepID=A0A6M0QA63_9BACI|nr:CamS family sex pheromone protein [Bacillus mesophilus]MBM7662757.1 protein involved in sex pheromone biosynthesis [Bacillus mesophilus]NEY73183.1 CamS family sex pheromone protein [Bacillus mesophilus]